MGNTILKRVKIEQFKCLEDLDTQIDGMNVMLLADNEAGKSSWIQFVEIALGRTNNIPPNVYGKGVIWADKNGVEYKIQVKVDEGRSFVKITGSNGLKDERKGVLAGIFGAMDFDINYFVELSKTDAGRKKQIDIFRQLLPADVREFLDGYDFKIKSHYDERTTVGKKVAELKGAIKASPLYGVPFKKTRIDITDVANQITRANEYNTKISGAKQRRDERDNTIKRVAGEIEELKAKLAAKLAEAEELEKLQRDADKWLAENKPVDVSHFNQQLQEAEKNNEEVKEWETLKAREKELEKTEEEYGDLTALIDSCKEAVKNCIQDMDSPIAGLSYDEECLLYNGIPVDSRSMSESQIMRLGTLFKFAENPECGLLFLNGTESFGKKRWEDIMAMAAEKGWKIIAEKVDDSKSKLEIQLFS